MSRNPEYASAPSGVFLQLLQRGELSGRVPRSGSHGAAPTHGEEKAMLFASGIVQRFDAVVGASVPQGIAAPVISAEMTRSGAPLLQRPIAHRRPFDMPTDACGHHHIHSRGAAVCVEELHVLPSRSPCVVRTRRSSCPTIRVATRRPSGVALAPARGPVRPSE
jgi:hypothetical protein